MSSSSRKRTASHLCLTAPRSLTWVSVVAFYGHHTHAVVPEAQVIAVPDGISDMLALLSILTCDAAKGVRKVVPMPEEPALITGAGAIGLLTLFILRAYSELQIARAELVLTFEQLAEGVIRPVKVFVGYDDN